MQQRYGPLRNASPFAIGLALLAIGIGALGMWQLSNLILIVFAAVLIAVLLDAAAGVVRRVAPVGQTVAVIVSVVVLLALFLGTIAVLGARTAAELSELSAKIPAAIDKLENWVNIGSIETWIAERIESSAGAASVLSGISGMTSMVVAAASGVLLALAGGLFFAISPGTYRYGAVRLLPERMRLRGRQTLDAIGGALRAWLLGQLVAMFVVGMMTAVGLWLLGVSTPIGLGVIAGLLEFIPYVGPVASAIPAVGVAFVDSPTTALWVGLLYLAIQQVEGTLLIPLIQREAVDLPPAVTVFSVVGFGILLGPAGLVLAAPLTVVLLVVVQRVWIPYVEGRTGAGDDGGGGAGTSGPPGS